MSCVEVGLGQYTAVSTELSWKKDSSEEGKMLLSTLDGLAGDVLVKQGTADHCPRSMLPGGTAPDPNTQPW